MSAKTCFKLSRIVVFLLVLLLVATAVTSSQPLEVSQRQDGGKTGRVLFYIPMISKSIRVKVWPLIEGMAARGHDVVAVMPFCSDEEAVAANVTVLHTEVNTKGLNTGAKDIMDAESAGFLNKFFQIGLIFKKSIVYNDNAMGHPRLEDEIDKGFDAVVVYTSMPHYSGYYLAEKSNASLVLYSTSQGPTLLDSWAMGQPFNPAYMPLVIISKTSAMSFLEKVANFLGCVLTYTIQHFILIPQFEELVDKYFPGEPRPSLLQLESNASLLLYTGHPILDGISPVNPNFQYIGFAQCRQPEPLPSHLDEFISGAEDGAIYVSFGSIFASDQRVMEVMRNVFGKLKQRVIWKWDTTLEEKPDNVLVSKWLPQQDILGHPKTRLFITHGGQSSVQEALCLKKPVIVIPLAFDQPFYADRAEKLGFGKSVSYVDMSEEMLMSTIMEVLNNNTYAEAAEKIGNVVLDQTTRPLDRGIWWLEFVMQHKESNYFRSPVHDLAWFQYFLLDVGAFISIILLLGLFSCFCLCRCICKTGGCLTRKKPKPTFDQSNQKKKQ